MHRWLCRCWIALALAPVACTSTPKKNASIPATIPAKDPNKPFWAADSPASPAASIPGRGADLINTPANDPEISGVLAGRVVDAYNRPVKAGSIQVVEMASFAPRPPTEVELDPDNQGRFYIRGLQPGRTYRLIARSRGDEKLLVGEVQVRPPDSRLVIPITEDFASGATPALPGAPEPLIPKRSVQAHPPDGSPNAGLGAPRAGDPGVRPDTGASPSGRAALPTPAPPPAGGLAIGADDSRRSGIEPQSFTATPPVAPPAPFTPSCVVQGGRLRNLVLNDLDGQPWSFAQHRGQLVLLDFWGTWCGPCVRALPEIVRLNSQYGDRGLEVVGIACERSGPADAARRVRQTQSRVPGLDYRILLSEESGRCPVQTQFQISAYPTLVLLDSEGSILWRGHDVSEAERVIRKRLGF